VWWINAELSSTRTLPSWALFRIEPIFSRQTTTQISLRSWNSIIRPSGSK
jgi:hypothetical protein